MDELINWSKEQLIEQRLKQGWELADQASMHGHQRKGRVKRPFSKEKKT